MFEPHDALRSVSLDDLASTMARALSEKLGVEMKVSINQIDFHSIHSVKANISFSVPSLFDLSSGKDVGAEAVNRQAE